MADDYPLEALLRPPVEWVSAIACGAAGAALVAVPNLFWLQPGQAWAACGVLSLWVVWRIRQGRKVRRYQRNLRSLPRYALRADEIPWSRHRLFLGMGFRWDSRHTERLMLLRRQENRRFTQVGFWYRLARLAEIRLEHTPLEPVADWLKSDHPLNLLQPMPEVGGDPALHGVEPREEAIYQGLGERVGHTLVLGTTRVGKSRLLEVLVTQDIRRGDTVIVFDPKGDAGILQRLYAEAARSGRLSQFYFFHLGYPTISARYNPIGEFSRITEVATRIANQMPSEGQSAAFKQFVWRFINGITRADVALGHRPSYARLYRHAENIEPLVQQYLEHWLDRLPECRRWRVEIEGPQYAIDEKKLDRGMKSRSLELIKMIEYVRRNALYDQVASSLIGVVQYEGSYFQKLVASLYPFLEKVTSGQLAELLSPEYVEADDPRPAFTWQQILENGGIVYVGLDALEDQPVASAVGNAMFSDLTSLAGKIYKHGMAYGQIAPGESRRLCIHADELNELIGDEFIPMVNKAGGANYLFTGYTQARADMEARFGNAAKALQAEGNFNTLIMMRVLGEVTAELLTRAVPEVEVRSLVPSSGASDANDPADFAEFSSRTEDRVVREMVPMLTTADIISLPKGQAFVRMNGGQVFKIRLPLPDASKDSFMPPNLAAVATDMKKRYAAHQSGWQSTPLTIEGRGIGF
ncbi:MAG: type IV conjugative transfer system coupling protein TraD [Betaproteobacteria bacterium]|nr:type IV conjugative transfer system coupling protein TraD [Betaproteobacteria bacterium]